MDVIRETYKTLSPRRHKKKLELFETGTTKTTSITLPSPYSATAITTPTKQQVSADNKYIMCPFPRSLMISCDSVTSMQTPTSVSSSFPGDRTNSSGSNSNSSKRSKGKYNGNGMVVGNMGVGTANGGGGGPVSAGGRSKLSYLLDDTTTSVSCSDPPTLLQSQKVNSSLSKTSREFFTEQGYTTGLLEALEKNKSEFPLSIWMADNSISMEIRDGHRIDPIQKSSVSSASSFESPTSGSSSTSNNGVKFTKCSRWEEIQQTLDYHAKMAAILKARTIFRFVNDPASTSSSISSSSSSSKTKNPKQQLQQQQHHHHYQQQQQQQQQQQFGIATSDIIHDGSMTMMIRTPVKKRQVYEDLKVAQDMIRDAKPCGSSTPLTQCLIEIRTTIHKLIDSRIVAKSGKRIVLVIATDGVPANSEGEPTVEALQEFSETLLTLRELPVWVVIRLCTDDDSVVDYWNNFDVDGFDIEVLDDYVSEAKEVYQHNKWLNYGLPLHRIREMGFYDDVFDLLDERPLTKNEIRDFCTILLGQSIIASCPIQGDLNDSDDIKWDQFCHYIEQYVIQESMLWNPIRKRIEPWINMKELKRSVQKYKPIRLATWFRRASMS